jgi:periplasmic divalent cation tolerance protein
MIERTSIIVVTTTTATKDQALAIGRTLVERRLAACVQTSGPIASCYRWRGAVETAEEWLCTIKTTAALYDAVERALREMHPYEQPEILAVEAVRGDEGYSRWVRDETAG